MMHRTAHLTLQVNVSRIDHDTARVSLPVPDNFGRYHEMIVPTSALELDDPYEGWHVKTLQGNTPARGATLVDASGRPRVRFFQGDHPGLTTEQVADCASDFLDHLRVHFPEGI